jgi:hypothetical protein
MLQSCSSAILAGGISTKLVVITAIGVYLNSINSKVKTVLISRSKSMIRIKTYIACPSGLQQNSIARLIRKPVAQNGYMKKAKPKTKKRTIGNSIQPRT